MASKALHEIWEKWVRAPFREDERIYEEDGTYTGEPYSDPIYNETYIEARVTATVRELATKPWHNVDDIVGSFIIWLPDICVLTDRDEGWRYYIAGEIAEYDDPYAWDDDSIYWKYHKRDKDGNVVELDTPYSRYDAERGEWVR